MTWAALAALLALALGASWRAMQPPAPLGPDASPARFSEGRAREVVRHLAGDIGLRVNGTPGHARAAEWLAGELRRIPGLEVEVQPVAGTAVYRSSWLPAFVYRTVNVVARLPGRSPEAILLDAHFDTLIDSVGAADDATGVAAIVEALQVLAREAPFARTIVVNLNGGEESALCGAAGFLKHRWARDVRAYLYLEALPGGRAILFGAGPGGPALASTYARVAPEPVANIVGEDLVEGGYLPHNGDFTPFHEAGLPGLDVAMAADGWAYHDALDRPERLQPGGLQHMGDTAVAVTRALADGAAPLEVQSTARSEPVVYYDVLGVAMTAYGARTARALAIAALVLAALALGLALRRGAITARATLAALGWTLFAVIAGVGAALGAGLLLARGLGRPHGWFSAPLLLLPAFAAPALAATFGVRALWRRRALRRTDAAHHAFAAWAAGLIFWSVWLALAATRGVGAGYLALHWVWPSALGLIAALTFPRAARVLALVSLLPGAALTIELGVLFLRYFVPITGLIAGPPQPFDAQIAVLVGAIVAGVGVLGFVPPQREGGLGRAAVACAAVAIAGIAATATRFPYTPERPKRILLAHVADDSPGAERSAILLRSGDALPLGSLLAPDLGFEPARGKWPSATWMPPYSHERAAPPPALAPPRIEVLGDAYDPMTDHRELRLRVAGPDAQLRLGVPAARLVAWSLDAPPSDVMVMNGLRMIHLEGMPPEGMELSFTVRGRAPLPVVLHATAREPARDPDVESVARRLPPWTTTSPTTMRTLRLEL